MKTFPVKYYIDTLTKDEVEFLISRLSSERKRYKKVIGIAYIFAVLLPLIFGVVMTLFIHYAPKSNPKIGYKPLHTEDIIQMAFIGLISLFIIISVAFALAYFFNINPIVKDIRSKKKIVELSTITEKKYMPQNDSYHFYLKDSTEVSVEVDEEMYRELQVGDEMNIEYGYYSRIPFGSF